MDAMYVDAYLGTSCVIILVTDLRAIHLNEKSPIKNCLAGSPTFMKFVEFGLNRDVLSYGVYREVPVVSYRRHITFSSVSSANSANTPECASWNCHPPFD